VEVAQEDYAIYREVIVKLMTGESPLPALPSITSDIRDGLASASISALSLSKLIAKDAALSQQLMRYATSVTIHSLMPPQTLLDVVRVLGMDQVGRIAMVHTIKNLFMPQSPIYKRFFLESWDRLILKASTSAFLAKALGKVIPDYALLGCLMTEIGSLAVLSALTSTKYSAKESEANENADVVVETIVEPSDVPIPEDPPTKEIYVKLCREYAKPLGEKILTEWRVEEEYIALLRKIGDWRVDKDTEFGLIDVVNLGLYHSLKARMVGRSLPSLSELSAYNKLKEPKNFITDTNELEIVVTGRDDIKAIAESLH
jgi:hypothetical protein